MKPVLVLTFVGLCSALLLAMVNKITEEPIRVAMEKIKIEALSQTFPFEVKDVQTQSEGGATFFELRDTKDSELKGVGVETFTEKGFGGKISILLAVSSDCKIHDYKVLSHLETPGLGDKIAADDFRSQFKGKSLWAKAGDVDGKSGASSLVWKVKKDGGFVDELTAATISTRAITDAVVNGLKQFSKKYPGRCQ